MILELARDPHRGQCIAQCHVGLSTVRCKGLTVHLVLASHCLYFPNTNSSWVIRENDTGFFHLRLRTHIFWLKATFHFNLKVVSPVKSAHSDATEKASWLGWVCERDLVSRKWVPLMQQLSLNLSLKIQMSNTKEKINLEWRWLCIGSFCTYCCLGPEEWCQNQSESGCLGFLCIRFLR